MNPADMIRRADRAASAELMAARGDGTAASPVRSFLSILDLSHDDLHRLLDLAAQLKSDRRLGRHAPTAGILHGSHVALLFEKPSLRTRSTFEIAVRELGGHVLEVSPQFGDGVREPLGTGVVTGGGDVPRPFTGQITFSPPAADHGALVLLTHSAEDGRVRQAAVLRLRFP